MFKSKFTSSTIIIVLILVETINISKNNAPNENPNKVNITENSYVSNLTNNIKSIILTNAIEESNDKIKQKKLNKMMHILNGNRQKDKTYTHYKLMNIN